LTPYESEVVFLPNSNTKFEDADVEVKDVGEYESDAEEEDVRKYVDVEDDFESLSEGEEAKEEGRKRGLSAPKFKQYNKEHDLLDPKFHMGMEFPTIHDCRQAIRYYNIAYARKIKYLKNEPYMVRLVCDDAPKGNEVSIKDLTTTTKR
ncbi:unnamed protein product, partial [Prunus brigantina]